MIQQAHIIFQDRINTFKKMKEIDAVLDDKPTKELVKQLAELRIRNEDCFRELKTLNDTGKFKFVHPLLKQFSLRSELETKLQKNPSSYLEDYANTRENVKRYRSFMNNAKRSKDQNATDKANFEKYQEREKLMKEVLESKNTPL